MLAQVSRPTLITVRRKILELLIGEHSSLLAVGFKSSYIMLATHCKLKCFVASFTACTHFIVILFYQVIVSLETD